MNFVKQVLYNHFLTNFLMKEKNNIGLELEYPIINLNQEVIDLSVLQKLMNYLLNRFPFEIKETDLHGNIISIVNNDTNDIISFEYSFNTLEYSMGDKENLCDIASAFLCYFHVIQDFLLSHGMCLSGFGLHPYYKKIDVNPIHSARYQMIYSFLKLSDNFPRRFHPYTAFCSFICSSQVHLDVALDKIPLVFNILSSIEWLKALLFSNSILFDENNQIINDTFLIRDYLWTNSMFSYNPRNVGTYDEDFHNFDDIIDCMMKRSVFHVMRDNEYIFFYPIRLIDYFSKPKIEGYINNGKTKNKVSFKPEENDIQYFRSYKSVELTRYGTLEIRTECQQPVMDVFAPGAFNLGIIENIASIYEYLSSLAYLKKYSNSYMRKIASTENGIFFIDQKEKATILLTILQLIEEGLRKRGFNEEKYIFCLYERAEKITSPGRRLLQSLKLGESLLDVIKQYSNVR